MIMIFFYFCLVKRKTAAFHYDTDRITKHSRILITSSRKKTMVLDGYRMSFGINNVYVQYL